MTQQDYPPDFRALCAELADSLEEWLSSNSIDGISLDDGTDAELIYRARAALSQSVPQGPTGRPAIEPVPVAERLPGPEDCDAYGRYWIGQMYDNDDRNIPNWELSYFGDFSHQEIIDAFSEVAWLPHHALPVPGQEADRD